MNKNDFGIALKIELDKKFDIVKLSRWALRLYTENCKDLDNSMFEILQTLFSMEDDPQFEYTEKELKLLAEMLINNKTNPIQKLNKLKSKGNL